MATIRSNMEPIERQFMPDKDYRALLTDREIEILQGEADVSEKYYYRVVSRVRNKIQRLARDLAVLDEQHETLGDELREVVCDDQSDE